MSARVASIALLLTGLVGGTLIDRSTTTDPATLGPYRVLEADFHVHSFLGDGVVSPFNVVLQARRQGLHALAITNHNQVFAARLARWFSRRIDGPIVLVGQEITSPEWHVIAAGIERKVAWRQTAEQAIAQIHEQGGVAIAAHPTRKYWPGFPAETLARLDGAERMHPLIYVWEERREDLPAFYDRAREINPDLAAIGSSDFHVLNWLGICRTHVFVTRADEAGLLEALREGRTVVFDRQGAPHGDPALIRMIRDSGYEPVAPRAAGEHPSPAELALRICGWLGLAGVLILRGRPPTRRRGRRRRVFVL